MTALRRPVDQPRQPLVAQPRSAEDLPIGLMLNSVNERYEHTLRRLGR